MCTFVVRGQRCNWKKNNEILREAWQKVVLPSHGPVSELQFLWITHPTMLHTNLTQMLHTQLKVYVFYFTWHLPDFWLIYSNIQGDYSTHSIGLSSRVGLLNWVMTAKLPWPALRNNHSSRQGLITSPSLSDSLSLADANNNLYVKNWPNIVCFYFSYLCPNVALWWLNIWSFGSLWLKTELMWILGTEIWSWMWLFAVNVMILQ